MKLFIKVLGAIMLFVSVRLISDLSYLFLAKPISTPYVVFVLSISFVTLSLYVLMLPIYLNNNEKWICKDILIFIVNLIVPLIVLVTDFYFIYLSTNTNDDIILYYTKNNLSYICEIRTICILTVLIKALLYYIHTIKRFKNKEFSKADKVLESSNVTNKYKTDYFFNTISIQKASLFLFIIGAIFFIITSEAHLIEYYNWWVTILMSVVLVPVMILMTMLYSMFFIKDE